jgi:hypothetical protein
MLKIEIADYYRESITMSLHFRSIITGFASDSMSDMPNRRNNRHDSDNCGIALYSSSIAIIRIHCEQLLVSGSLLHVKLGYHWKLLKIYLFTLISHPLDNDGARDERYDPSSIMIDVVQSIIVIWGADRRR